MTGYERVDAGEVYLGDRKITNLRAAAGVRPGHRPDLPAHPDLPPADRDGEHAGRRAARRARRAAAQPAGPGGRARRPAAGRRTCSSSPASPATPTRWPRPCPTASASCWSCPTCWSPNPAIVLLDEPAGGVNPSLIRHARRPDPRAQRGGHDVPDRGAQHGLRDGPVRPGHGPGLRDRGRHRAAARSSGPIPGCSTPISASAEEDDDAARGGAARAGHRGPGVRLRRRRRAARGVHDRGRGRDHLRRGAERGGQVDPARAGQRAAAAAPGDHHVPRRAAGRQEPAPDPGPGPGARAAEPQPVPGDDGQGEHRARRLHRQGPVAAGPPAGRHRADVPAGRGLGREEGRQPVRGRAAAGGVRPLPDARPGPGDPGRAVHGPVAQGAPVGASTRSG